MGTLKLNKQIANNETRQINVAENSSVEKADKMIEEQNISDINVENIELCELAKQDEGFVEEFENLRTANETVYRRNDRTCRKIITAAPTRYVDDNNEIKNISNRLIDNGKEIINEANSFKVKFNKDAQNGKIFELRKGAKSLTLSAVGSAKTRNHTCGCKCELCADSDNKVSVTLDNGTEIQYLTLNDRIKENIIVKERQESYEYNFTLDIGDLTVEEGENNELLLKDASTGETEFIIPAPFMFDSSDKRSNEVSYEIDISGQTLNIKVVASAEFINADDTKLPIIIDPQIVTNTAGLFSFETTEAQSDRDDYYNDILQVGCSIGDRFFFSKIGIQTSLIPMDANTKSVKLQLTAKSGAYGGFYFNNDLYEAISDKVYTLDITDKIKGVNFAQIELQPDWPSSWIEFYTTGDYMPKIILTSVNESDEAVSIPNIKEFNFNDKISSYIDLNYGVMTTAVKIFDGDDLAVPMNIIHYHKKGNGANSCGNNWRLNLDRKLIVAKDDTDNNTSYTYIDEAGNNYNFIELYYYLDNGKRVFVAKDKVGVDIFGNLTFESKPVYRHQSCNGYTLVPEINDFIGAELIEQRQNEQIQLEQTVQAYENSLIDYVVVMGSDILRGLANLSKAECKSFFDYVEEHIYDNSNYIVMTKSDVCQLKSNNPYLAEYIAEKAQRNYPQVKEAFKMYFSKKAELEQLWRSVPVRYLRDKDGVISGFNKYGDLVYVCNAYGNYVAIERDAENKIIGIYDSYNKVVNFEYSQGLLQSVTDSRGRTVQFGYNNKKLLSVTYPDGSSFEFEYSSDNMRSIKTTDDFQYKFSTDNTGKVKTIATYTTDITISTSVFSKGYSFSKTLDTFVIEYDAESTAFTDRYNNKEIYRFGADKKLISYQEEKNTGVITVTDYKDYEVSTGRYHISTQSTNLDNKVVKITEKYDDANLLISTETDWQWVSKTVKVKTQTTYEYDNNENLIQERTVKYKNVSGVDKQIASVKKYRYNSYGSLTLIESYDESGYYNFDTNFEERIYDDKGRVTKTIKWNSLDSSTKFYSEQVYADNGRVAADKNEEGNVSADYEYVNGANLINSVKYPNGSKLAYGRNPYNDVITSVTRSTEDGECNSNEIFYAFGMPVQVGNNYTYLDYTYDYTRRKTKVKVNGVERCSFLYKDYSYNTKDNTCTFGSQTITYKSGRNIFSFVYSKTGVLDETAGKMIVTELTKIGDVEQFKKVYNAKGQLEMADDNVSKMASTFHYDDYGNVINISSIMNDPDNGRICSVNEKYDYDEYGLLSTRSVTTACGHQYSYSYKDKLSGDLDYISFGDYKFKPLTDANGRNTGKEVYNGENKVAGEYISYKKVGDRATNLPSTVWFASGTDTKDNIRYKYDNCGNICEITENGHIVAKYKYDALNRLIREDNKALNKTVVYAYDTNGNISERCEYPYTTKSGEELSELECTHFEYLYDGDKLLSYNGEKCEYDDLGNPTTYRNKSVVWQYGKYLKTYDGNIFVYDGRGRRIRKNNTRPIYDYAGNLICIYPKLQFVYDNSSVIGFIHNETQYFYRKDVQGNIIAILDESGAVVVKYVYDAWGNHAVLDADGNDIDDAEHIGNLNPFRYRGYYYDVETGLYYLQTRYYDPETGRFISQDSIEYADPKKINGLNLFAYCSNNPIMGYDPTGTTEWWEWALALFGLTILAAGAVGLTIVSGGTASSTIALVADLGASILTGMVVGGTFSLATQADTGHLDWGQFGIDIAVGGVSGAISFGVGEIFSSIGYGVGTYINQISIRGLSVGRVFTNMILPKIFQTLGKFFGGTVGGVFIDKVANNIFGKEDNLRQRILNNLQGTFWSSIIQFLLGLS